MSNLLRAAILSADVTAEQADKIEAALLEAGDSAMWRQTALYWWRVAARMARDSGLSHLQRSVDEFDDNRAVEAFTAGAKWGGIRSWKGHTLGEVEAEMRRAGEDWLSRYP